MANDSKSQKRSGSEPSPNTDTSTTGKPTPKGKGFSIKKASPDAPIFTRGFVSGGCYTRRSSKDPQPKTDPSPQSDEPDTDESPKEPPRSRPRRCRNDATAGPLIQAVKVWRGVGR